MNLVSTQKPSRPPKLLGFFLLILLTSSIAFADKRICARTLKGAPTSQMELNLSDSDALYEGLPSELVDIYLAMETASGLDPDILRRISERLTIALEQLAAGEAELHRPSVERVRKHDIERLIEAEPILSQLPYMAKQNLRDEIIRKYPEKTVISIIARYMRNPSNNLDHKTAFGFNARKLDDLVYDELDAISRLGNHPAILNLVED